MPSYKKYPACTGPGSRHTRLELLCNRSCVPRFFTAVLAGYKLLAGEFALLWLGLTLHFASRRLRETRHTPGHILEMVYTSILIPPLSIFWRLYGAFHYRVLFF